jgi:hypothetical protein
MQGMVKKKLVENTEPCVQQLFNESYRETGMGSARNQLAWGFVFYASGKLVETMDNQKEYKGLNGTLVLTNRAVIIKRGARGFFNGGGMLRGDKTIPYTSIVAVQLKLGRMLSGGFIQLTLLGGSEAKGGIIQAATDENSISFNRKFNDLFLEAKEIIEQHMHKGVGQISEADDLEKYARLRDKGIVTEAEFQAKKKQILGL